MNCIFIQTTTEKRKNSYGAVFLILIVLFFVCSCNKNSNLEKIALGFRCLENSDVLVYDSDVLVFSDNFDLQRINSENAQVKWSKSFTELSKVLAFEKVDKFIYFAGIVDNTTMFWLINPEDGSEIFKFDFKKKDAETDPLFYKGELFFIPETFGVSILRINPTDSTIQNHLISGLKFGDGFPVNLVAYKNKFYTTAARIGLYEIDAETMETIKVYDVEDVELAKQNFIINNLLVINGYDMVKIFNLDTKKLECSSTKWKEESYLNIIRERVGVNENGDTLIFESLNNDTTWFLNASTCEEVQYMNPQVEMDNGICVNKNTYAIASIGKLSFSKSKILVYNISNGELLRTYKLENKPASPLFIYKNGYAFINQNNELCLIRN